MNFRKTTFILSDQPTGIQKTERIIRILKRSIQTWSRSYERPLHTRSKQYKRFGSRKDGEITNSHSERNSFHIGTGYVGESFYIGAAYQNSYSYFGAPGYAMPKMPEHSHGNKPQEKIDYLPINVMSLTHKAMLESAYKFRKFPIASIKLSYMGVFSENTEMLDKRRANQLDVNQHNGRVEFVQQKMKFLTGTTGVEMQYREMDGSGNLRYLPNNISREIGFYTMQHLNFNFLEFDLGYRNDHVQRRADADKNYVRSRGMSGGKLSDRDFTLNQYHAGMTWNIFKKPI